MKMLFALVLVLALLAACSGSGSSSVTLGDNDNGKTVDVAANGTITVTLESNPTTGYKWDLPTPPDAQVVKFVSSKYNPPSEQIPGRGGTETWVFQAVGAGTAKVNLRYLRPFAPQDNPKDYSFTVNVK